MSPRAVPAQVWLADEAIHQARVDALVAPRLHRASRHIAHPVEDFMFSYYTLAPAKLRRWHPGWDRVLLGEAAKPRLSWRFHTQRQAMMEDATAATGVGVDLEAFLAHRSAAVRQAVAVMRATADRTPQFTCFGLHEWAMVYRQRDDERRHARWPLRLSRAETDAVVEANSLRCTHFDAYRFFTAPAVPRNQTELSRTGQVEMEQPGCLHAGMDLYKWAYQLLPVVSSALLLETFELARDIRTLDMQASPYDLTALGYEPVAIETSTGRAAYAARQRAFADRAQDCRRRLLAYVEPALIGLAG